MNSMNNMAFLNYVVLTNRLARNDTTNLATYFNIHLDPSEKLSIHVNKISNEFCTLSVNYSIQKNRNLSELTNLPEDICKYINEYVVDQIHMRFKIIFPDNYPYFPPIWELETCNSSIPHSSLDYGGMTLYDYYKYVAERHTSYLFDWSPAITLETNILYFICRINVFRSFNN